MRTLSRGADNFLPKGSELPVSGSEGLLPEGIMNNDETAEIHPMEFRENVRKNIEIYNKISHLILLCKT